MRFRDFYNKPEPIVSFELFPPRTVEGLERLESRIPRLIRLEPSFMTVTYGALGSTRDRTLEIASKIRNEYQMETAHHLTCVGCSGSEIDEILTTISAHDIENVVALRGDPPQGQSHFETVEGGYTHACQLVEHIRKTNRFGIAVAGYPEKHNEARDLDTDLRHLVQKVNCGADVIITQLFYDNAHFYRFVQECRKRGIQKPIVPGLLPVLSLNQVRKITGLCGSVIPEDLLRRLDEAGDDERKILSIGISHTVEQVLDLLRNDVPGIHFYVLNRYFHIAEIMNAIKPALIERRFQQPSPGFIEDRPFEPNS